MSSTFGVIFRSNLRRAINQPAAHAAATKAGDPGTNNPQGYAAHYCDVPTPNNPKIVACSSGRTDSPATQVVAAGLDR
jgi:hypothetical protein